MKQVTWKQARKQTVNSSLEANQAFNIVSQNHSKIYSNPVNYDLESILLLPWSSSLNAPPGCARGAKMVPQGAKMEAPSPPWQLRGAEEPAAEGVGLQIFS